jgi:uncharacterized protein YukE
MPDVNVTYEAMENAATRMNTAHEDMIAEMSTMRAMVDDLVSSGFATDIASKSFHDGFTTFNNGVTETLEGLQVMSKYLVDYAAKLREIDTTSTITIDRS